METEQPITKERRSLPPLFLFAAIAQLVERLPSKQDVAGSIPVGCSIRRTP